MFFLVLGVSDGILGPTLLDLTDIIGISIDRISIMLIMKSAGSLFGCLLTGYLLDKFHKYLYFILSGMIILSVGLYNFFSLRYSYATGGSFSNYTALGSWTDGYRDNTGYKGERNTIGLFCL